MPGEKFVTSFGVVQVVADNRVVSSPDARGCPQPKPKEQRKEVLIRKKNRIFTMASKFQRKRRKKFLQLFNENVTGEKLREEVWKEYCPSTTPDAILSGAWSWGSQKPSAIVTLSVMGDEQPTSQVENPELDHDSSVLPGASPERIVECVLIKDERRKVIDINDDLLDEERLTKVDVAKAAVKKAKKEALVMSTVDKNAICPFIPDAIHESGMKLYLQRRLLEERYSAAIPIYQCIRCGRSFSSRLGLKGHLHENVCGKKAEQMVEDRLARLETIEKMVDADLQANPAQKEKCPPGPTVSSGTRKIKASLFKKLPGWIVFHHDRSSMYPEVCSSLSNCCLNMNVYPIQKLLLL